MTIKTLKASGGDYSSMSAWEAAQPATLSAPSELECYNFALSDNVAISGITTSAANYLRIYTPLTERHDGRARAISGTGFRISDSTSSGTIRVAADHVRFEGLEIEQTGTNTGLSVQAVQFVAFSAGSDVRVEKCIVHTAHTGTQYSITAATTNLNLIWRNNVAYGSSRMWDTRNAASVLCENSTFWRHQPELGLVSSSEATIKNTYCGHAGAASDDFWSGGTPSGNNNASSDTSAVTRFPTGSVNSVAGSAVFVSVTAGSEDFTLKSGTNALVEAGATLGSVTDDIIGTTRPQGGNYDIGAFERISAGGSITGTLAQIEGAETLGASGSVLISGTLASIEAGDTMMGSGSVLISGSLARAEGSDSLSGTGSVLISGTLARTEGADTLLAIGSLLNPITGTLVVTEGADTLVASNIPYPPFNLFTIMRLSSINATGSISAQAISKNGSMRGTLNLSSIMRQSTINRSGSIRADAINRTGNLL